MHAPYQHQHSPQSEYGVNVGKDDGFADTVLLAPLDREAEPGRVGVADSLLPAEPDEVSDPDSVCAQAPAAVKMRVSTESG